MKHLPAFTLIETLVAVSVLLISLVGPLSIAAQSLQSAYYARDSITASYLAQEGIEYVRARRDENYLAGRSWLSGPSASTALNDASTGCVGANCIVDFYNYSHTRCSGAASTCPPLYLNSTTGLYDENANTGTASPFTRVIRIDTVSDNPDEVVISVTVSWQVGKLTRQFVLSEYLFNYI